MHCKDIQTLKNIHILLFNNNLNNQNLCKVWEC